MTDCATDEVLRYLVRIDRRLEIIERDVALIRTAVQGHASRISALEAARLTPIPIDDHWGGEP